MKNKHSIPKMPPVQTAQKSGKSISTMNKVFIIGLGLLSIVMIVLSILDRCGLRLLQTDALLLGGLLMLLVMLFWGILNIFRRIKGKGARFAFAIAGTFLLMIAASLAFTYIQYVALLAMPTHYRTIASPHDNTSIAIMAQPDVLFDESEARIEARMNNRLAADPEADPETAEMTEDDQGLVLTAYPVAMKLFFNTNANVEGSIYMGLSSEAKLMYDWADPDTVRFYLENPEFGDSGEIIIHLDD